ncbi:MAG: energy-coupling factor ABC transporter ATP-binding protein [Deltaproteobacteria bacterium]|nr:energy-coupling factor ABC transporter ATP-binding protein [Deltaproteobacteria bacterium]
MNSAISIEKLSFTYSGKGIPALKNIQARIDEGSFVCIMGHGGAGKSSLCYSLNGLIPKFFRGLYQGRVVVKGIETAGSNVAGLSRRVGLVFQDFESQLFSTNVELEMAFGPENHGLPPSEIEKRIQRYLKAVNLEHCRGRQPATLSGGQKQRLAIGSVLTMEADILVLDEPTTDLDPQGAEEVLAVARHLRREGRTLVMVAPEPEMALEAEEVWLMREGELVVQGSPQEILRDLSKLSSSGIKPPALMELFQAMNWPGRPLTATEAMDLIDLHALVQKQENKQPPENLIRTEGPYILQAEGLEYSYAFQGVKALRGVNWNVREGEFIALLGQNGSGKTTLAKHCNGLLKSTAGRMLVRGKPTKDFSHKDLAQEVGYIFQNPDHQIFAKTVEEEISFGLKVLGRDPKTVRERMAEALEVVELQGYEKQLPFTLTKGERQRVAVASVLAVQPQVIILDEPTTGLDYIQQRRMMELLKRLNEKGHTIIIITHSMWVAAEYARRTVVLREGEIILDGPTRHVFAQEAKLAGASLSPPPLVQISNRLGLQALTLEQMVQELNTR